MNYSTAVMLINTNIRAVAVSYETDSAGNGIRPYTVFKTLDQNLKAGDYVIIPTDSRHKMTVARVEEVDVEIDFESSTEIKWLIGSVSTAENENILAEEKKWIEQLKAAEKRRKREEIKKNMLDMYNDDGSLEKLSIANMRGVEAIEHAKDE